MLQQHRRMRTGLPAKRPNMIPLRGPLRNGPDPSRPDGEGVAELLSRYLSDTQTCLAEWVAWLHLPATSGADCVVVLVRDGFTSQTVHAGCADLQRDGDMIRVPLVDCLNPEVLTAILHRASISATRFLLLRNK